MTDDVLTVRTERTPNPNSLKYNVGKVLIPGGSANFPHEASAARSPLAQRMFKVTGVEAVFIGSDFITITKSEKVDWSRINQELAPQLEDFFESGDSVLLKGDVANIQEIGADTADPELVARIKKLIDEKVRPAIAQDGGDILYRGFEHGVVFVEMTGACNGCPSSTITLKSGVESMLMHFCPEVTEVRAL